MPVQALNIYAVMLAFWPWSSDPYCLPKYLLAALFAALGLSKIPRTALDAPIALFLASLALSTALSVDWSISLWGQSGAYFTGLLPMGLVAATYYSCVGKPRLDRVFAIAGALCAVVAILQQFHIALPFPMPHDRSYGTIGSPVFMSAHLVLALPIALSLGMLWPSALIWTAILLSGSRAGVVGAAVGVLTLYAQGKTWRQLAVQCAVALPVACLALYLSLSVFLPKRSLAKSDLGRKYMAIAALESFKERPWVGNGPDIYHWLYEDHKTPQGAADLGNQWGNGYAHNSILEALSATGIIGLIAFCYLLFSVAGQMSGQMSLMAGAAALFAHAMFQPTPLTAKICLASLVGGVALQKQESGHLWRKAAYPVALVLLFALTLRLASFFGATRLALIGSDRRSIPILADAVAAYPNIFR